MTRELTAVAPEAVPSALRAALDGSGPALFTGADAAPGAIVPQRVALVVQSSGSTGRPKRVALSADALLASAAASDSALGGPGQWLLALPTSYIAGINVLVRSYAAGTEPVTMPPDRFTAEGFVLATARLDVRERWFASLVPAQLARLLDSREATAMLRRFSRVLVGGQATPAALLERCADEGVAVTRTYGSSETSGGCVYDGRPLAGVQVRIVDGEVQLAGPVLAEGYLDDPERTDAAFVTEAAERWYRTDDAGTLTDGVLVISGRLDDVIVSGGLKVSLGEVEALVRELVPDAVVVVADDDRWGQVPVVVSADPGASSAAVLDALRARIAERLGAAARPARLVHVTELPTLSSGKPDRLRIRRELAG